MIHIYQQTELLLHWMFHLTLVHLEYEWQDGNAPFLDLEIISLNHSIKSITQDGDS